MNLNDIFHPSWMPFFKRSDVRDAYFKALYYARDQEQLGKNIFPHGADILKAFRLTPLDNIKVVILGLDPYIRPLQATGLAFAVPDDVPMPPSLRNIQKALGKPLNRTLEHWSAQGAFLLNTALTVEEGKSGSHLEIWEPFTDLVIKEINSLNRRVVFCLWGETAQKKEALIDAHPVLKECHPSQQNGNKFIDAKPFERINKYVKIDW